MKQASQPLNTAARRHAHPGRRPLAPLALAIGLALALPSAMAAPINIDWLSYAPTPTTGFTAPTQGLYAGPSSNTYGPINLSYSTTVSSGMVTGVLLPGMMQNGNVASNAYNWGNAETFSRTSTSPSDPINQTWTVTYGFGTAMQLGDSLMLGIMGLGKRDANPGEVPGGQASIVTVNSPGTFTFLGEYDSSGLFAPTMSTITPNQLIAENSLSAPGGLNPNWNTKWAVYRYDANATVNSLTFQVDQTRGDGLGLNIGFVSSVPEPQSWTLLASGLALLGLRRLRKPAA